MLKVNILYVVFFYLGVYFFHAMLMNRPAGAINGKIMLNRTITLCKAYVPDYHQYLVCHIYLVSDYFGTR